MRMRMIWPDSAMAIPLGVWAMIRQREALPNRRLFLEKMKEPGMQRLLRDLTGEDWQINPANLISMVKRITRGHSWVPGLTRGRMPFLNPDQIIRLKEQIRITQVMGRTDFMEAAMDIHKEGLKHTEDWLRLLHHPELATVVRSETEDPEGMSPTWVARMVEKCQVVLRACEDLEEDRAKWGKTGVIKQWFGHYQAILQGVRPCLLLNADEVGVAIRDRTKLICLPGSRLFRLRGKKLPHFTVFPLFNKFGEGPAPFIVIPELLSAQARFRTIHRRKVYIAQSRSGWVTQHVFQEWAEWVCDWLEKYRKDRGLLGQQAVLILDNAPTRSSRQAMQLFRSHNVLVILLPPHLTHVLQPVDLCWAKQFKAKTTEAWHRYMDKRGVEEAAFEELMEDVARAPEKHRVRVRMVYSIWEAATSVSVLSSAGQGFWHAGLSPWSPALPLASVFITEGDMPGPLPLSPFEREQEPEEAVAVPEPLEADTLFDWVAPDVRPPNGALQRIMAVPRTVGRRRSPNSGRFRGRIPTIVAHPDAPRVPLAEWDTDGEGIVLQVGPETADIEAQDVDALAGDDVPWTDDV